MTRTSGPGGIAETLTVEHIERSKLHFVSAQVEKDNTFQRFIEDAHARVHSLDSEPRLHGYRIVEDKGWFPVVPVWPTTDDLRDTRNIYLDVSTKQRVNLERISRDTSKPGKSFTMMAMMGLALTASMPSWELGDPTWSDGDWSPPVRHLGLKRLDYLLSSTVCPDRLPIKDPSQFDDSDDDELAPELTPSLASDLLEAAHRRLETAYNTGVFDHA